MEDARLRPGSRARGPLHDPIVRRGEGDVRYADVQDQDDLRRYYADHVGIPVQSIPESDSWLSLSLTVGADSDRA